MKREKLVVCIIAMLLQGCGVKNSQDMAASGSQTEAVSEAAASETQTEVIAEGESDSTTEGAAEAATDTSETENDEKYVYDKDAWLAPDGTLDYPFDQYELLYAALSDEEKAAYYIVPQEAQDSSSTAELLRLCCKYIFVGNYSVFEQPGAFLLWVEDNMSVLQEAIHRNDYTQALLEVYQEWQLMPKEAFEDGAEQSAYNEEASVRDGGVVLLEILLADNETFDSMTEEMKTQVIDEVLLKLEQRDNGEYQCAHTKSGFFAYIAEQEYLEGYSAWYEYLMEMDSEYIAYIDSFMVGEDKTGGLYWE